MTAPTPLGWQQQQQQQNGVPPDPDHPHMVAETVSAAAIVMRRTSWLWGTQIPLGELTIGAGREGSAKSQFTIWVAARVTRGTLPGCYRGYPRAVIICAREDSWEKTILPRLWVAGADLSMVFRVRVRNAFSGKSYNLSLPLDNDLLRAEITRLRAALVIFDPLLSSLSPDLNTHRARDVRAAIEPLADIAHDTESAMLGLAHFAKTEGRDASSLISGSHAFKDVARSVLAFAMDSEDTGVLSHVKSNLGKVPRESATYSIAEYPVPMPGGGTESQPVFCLGMPTMRHVEDLLDQGRAREVARARDFLRGSLTASWRLSREIDEEAAQRGISRRTLQRARLDLGVVPTKGPDGKWWLHF